MTGIFMFHFIHGVYIHLVTESQDMFVIAYLLSVRYTSDKDNLMTDSHVKDGSQSDTAGVTMVWY